jgi:hypothetical protein
MSAAIPPLSPHVYLHTLSTSNVKNVWSLASLCHPGAVYRHIFAIHLAVTVTGGVGRGGERLLNIKWVEHSYSYWRSLLWIGSDCTSASAFSGCIKGHTIHTKRLARAFPRRHVSCSNRCLGMKKVTWLTQLLPLPQWHTAFPPSSSWLAL